MCPFAPRFSYPFRALAIMALTAAVGCQTVQRRHAPQTVDASGPVVRPMFQTAPRELSKVVLPTYRVEPPDILVIDAIHVVPKPPYRLRTFDSLSVDVQGALPDAPITGTFVVEPGGVIHLGAGYGSVRVGGKTVEEIRGILETHLRGHLADPLVTVALADMAGKQQIAGEHLVAPDGTVTLGTYGSVSVVGHTLAGAKRAIEAHLSQFLEEPEVSVDVFAYNSKVYYVITQGAGLGDGVYRFPVTGNETVLDAISQINGLQQVSSKKIWIARPTGQPGGVQILPVEWDAITAQASTDSNYQVLPGDRVFIAEDRLIALDTSLAKITAPLERIMGFSLLGVGTATRFSGSVLRGGGNPQGTF